MENSNTPVSDENKNTISEDRKMRISAFFAANNGVFSEERIPMMRRRLEQCSDAQFDAVCSVEYKSPTTMLIISIFLGEWGVDRFMLGDAGLGVLKLLTCGGGTIWWLIDVINISGKTKKLNDSKFDAVMY